MGFKLNVDLETSSGPSQEVYVRIESLTYNKVTSEIMLQLTYWSSRKEALRFNRTYLEEEARNAIGLISERVIYFNGEIEDEILLPHFLKGSIATRQEVEVPIYETQLTDKEIPYVSFDDNGDEITLYRTVQTKEDVQVGTKIETKQVIDQSVLNDTFGFAYSLVKKELTKWFPKDNIETIK